MSDAPQRLRVGVLISGRGSNLKALIEATEADGYPVEIVLALSNRPDAAGLEVAREFGVPAIAVDHRTFHTDREAHERVLDIELRAAGVELVALAGYMRIFTPWFVQAWAGRMINIHPSLLPQFPGTNTHARAIEAGCTVHGCTVHWVTEGVDAGPIIGFAETPVFPDDTPQTLAARVLEAEHSLYPACLAEAARQLRAGARPC